MALLRSDTETMTLAPAAQRTTTPTTQNASLLIVAADAATRFQLPPQGEVIIGRAADATLCLSDSSVSRRHALLTMQPDGIRIQDQDSHNGTHVNGQRIVGVTSLLMGDVIGIGEFSLILNLAQPIAARSLRDQVELRPLLYGELARALYAGRPLALLAIEAPDKRTVSRLAETLCSWMRPLDSLILWEDKYLVLLLPELAADDAQVLLQHVWPRLVAISAATRAGLASSPHDGTDGESLLATARAACHQAAPSAIATSESLVTGIQAGEHRIIIAEPAMRRLYALLQKLAASELPLLIGGETGTGKELAANVIHAASPRRQGPLLSLNCAAMPEALAESELFGHAKGAFSGAIASKPGLLESAAGGTVFLDEIGELPLPLQAKLLRALGQGQILRVGELRERAIDVRIIAATHRNLDDEVKAGRFRQDLLFRLKVAQIVLPPLRERRTELPVLVRALLADACAITGRAPLQLTNAAMQQILGYRWPGNVRELRNAMLYVASTCEESEVHPWHLPNSLEPSEPAGDPAPAGGGSRRFRPVADELSELESRRMLEALESSGGHHGVAAELIGMPRRTFAAKYKSYGLAQRRGR